MSAPVIPFIDLAAQRRRLGDRLERAITRVLDHGTFIMGPEVARLEAELAEYCGVRHVVTCSNGTDALALALEAAGVGVGDTVICPAFTFAATAETVPWLGAEPVFVDVDPVTFNMDPASLEAAIDMVERRGGRVRAVIAVDLFGLPADYDAIEKICARRGPHLLTDSAQSFGSLHRGRRAGAIGLAATTSFFPSKPLACCGDGGAVFTNDERVATVARSLRVHGQGKDKYDNVRIGRNARLDTIQAAILLEKLAILPEELEARNAVARRYDEGLGDLVAVPRSPEGRTSSWAQYTLRIDGDRRDAVASTLKAEGVPTMIYYSKPLHRQTANARYAVVEGGAPVSERLCGEVLSLPMHPYLKAAVQDRIIDAVRRAIEGAG